MRKIKVFGLSFILSLFIISCSSSSFVQNSGRMNYAKKQGQIQTQSNAIEQSEEVAIIEEIPESYNKISSKIETTEASPTADKPESNNSIDVKSAQVEKASQEVTKKEIKSLIKSEKKDSKHPNNTAKATSGDDQLIALLLCIFLGMFGVHRFYLGDKKRGMLILALTLIGAVFFWLPIISFLVLFVAAIIVFIDFIKLIIGSLGPGW